MQIIALEIGIVIVREVMLIMCVMGVLIVHVKPMIALHVTVSRVRFVKLTATAVT